MLWCVVGDSDLGAAGGYCGVVDLVYGQALDYDERRDLSLAPGNHQPLANLHHGKSSCGVSLGGPGTRRERGLVSEDGGR